MRTVPDNTEITKPQSVDRSKKEKQNKGMRVKEAHGRDIFKKRGVKFLELSS